MGMAVGILIVGTPLACLFAWIVMRLSRRNSLTSMSYWKRFTLAAYVFLVFFATLGMDILLLGPAAFQSGIHLVNFKPFIWLQETYLMGWKAMVTQVLLNILMFVPLGFLLPLTFPRFQSLRKTLLLLSVSSLAIEFLQYFIGRSADVDDLIMNSLGALGGWLIYRAFRSIIKTDAQRASLSFKGDTELIAADPSGTESDITDTQRHEENNSDLTDEKTDSDQTS